MYDIKIWLDDVRIPPGPDWLVAKTVDECVKLLSEFRNRVYVISLDHDLGSCDAAEDGNEVLMWMERMAFHDRTYEPPQIIRIHTSNPVARVEMEQTVQSIRRIEATRR